MLSALQGEMGVGPCAEVTRELGPAGAQVPSRELRVPEELGEGM